MTAPNGWRKALQLACRNRCIICGEAIAPSENSWDHFVPRAQSPKANHGYRIGVVYQAHRKCNADRGHKPPSSDMIDRAADTILDLDDENFEAAATNIASALREQLVLVETLRALQAAVQRRLQDEDLNDADGG